MSAESSELLVKKVFFLQLPRKHEGSGVLIAFKLALMTFTDLKQLFGLIITSKSNSTFVTIGKATGIKMTAKVVGKNSNFSVSVKNNLNM